jgi:hypothetical protein
MKLLLPVHGADDLGDVRADFAVLDLYPALARQYLREITTAKQVSKKLPAFYHLTLWNCAARFYEQAIGWLETHLTPEQLADFDGGNWLTVPDDFAPPEDKEQRTECDRRRVSRTGVRFVCYVKHTDYEQDTDEIGVETLTQAAKEKPRA